MKIIIFASFLLSFTATSASAWECEATRKNILEKGIGIKIKIRSTKMDNSNNDENFVVTGRWKPTEAGPCEEYPFRDDGMGHNFRMGGDFVFEDLSGRKFAGASGCTEGELAPIMFFSPSNEMVVLNGFACAVVHHGVIAALLSQFDFETIESPETFMPLLSGFSGATLPDQNTGPMTGLWGVASRGGSLYQISPEKYEITLP